MISKSQRTSSLQLPTFTLVLLLAGLAGFSWTFTSSAQITGSADVNVSRLANYQNECAIAKNPTNKMQLFAACNNAGPGLFAARSDDLGATWTYPDPVDRTLADGDAGQGPLACCDPTLTWDSFGNLYLGYLRSGASGVVILLSTDSGRTFTTLTTFLGSTDQPTVVAANTTAAGAPVALWIVWNQSNRMRASGAAVTGLGAVGAFGAVQTIPGTLGCSFGDVAIAPSGAVVQACQNPTGDEGPATIRVNIDADGLGPGNFGSSIAATTTNVGGFDFIPAQNVRSIDAEAGLAFDSFAMSPHFGRLYLVYTEETAAENNDTDIMVRFSDNIGATWSTPIRVNDDPVLPIRSQFLPRIASNPLSGNIAVCWHDARGSLSNNTMQEYCTIATPKGSAPNFQASTPISDGTATGSGSSPPAAGQRDIQYGDYSGLAYFQGRVHPIWADNSNSTADNPNGTGRYDAYTDIVSGGTAACEGDPHITTVDGLRYDFQSAGEFVALTGDGLEIQTRQTAIATSFNPGTNAYTGLATCVSLNTAVAAQVGSHRVTYQPRLDGVPDPSGLELRIDGALRTLPAMGINLAGGGRIEQTQAPGGLRILFPNETRMVVTPGWWASQSKWYLNLNAYDTTAGEGIMGALSRGSWLPALADGSSLGAKPADPERRYVELYETFADSWRVNSSTSLFDYSPGSSTADFTLDSWPRRNPPCILPREPVAKPLKPGIARRVCRTITDPGRRADCEFDVTVTGERGFATTYLATQRIEAIETGVSDPDPGPVSISDRLLTGSFHIGSTHPLGELDGPTDSNIHFRLDASYPFTDRFRLLAMAGYSQLTAETASGADHPRWINLSVNIQTLLPTASGLKWFVQGGPGVYWPESGSSEVGFNLGFGAQIPFGSGPNAIEIGADYHNVQTDFDDLEFLTVQLGVLFR